MSPILRLKFWHFKGGLGLRMSKWLISARGILRFGLDLLQIGFTDSEQLRLTHLSWFIIEERYVNPQASV
jgi:hypothetical protein